MAVIGITCSNCSAPLDPALAVGGMIRCSYCRMVFQVAGAQPLAAPVPQPAGTSGMVRVVLESAPGNKKIHTIKVLRDATGLGLKESKDMVDGMPSVVGVMDASKAQKLVREAAAIGAVVKLHPV
jgi:large subunit ribosomal protein L7/L12